MAKQGLSKHVKRIILGPFMIYAPTLAESKVIKRRDKGLWWMQAGWMNVSGEVRMFRGSDG